MPRVEKLVCAGAGGGTPVWMVALLAAVNAVVVAGGVDLTEVSLGGGALGGRRLGAVRSGSAANLRGAAVVEVLGAAGGGEVGTGAPGGEASEGVGGAASEETGNKAGESEGGYFEEATRGSGGLSGAHDDLSKGKCVQNAGLQGTSVARRLTLLVQRNNDPMVAVGIGRFGVGIVMVGGASCILIASSNIRYIDSK